MKLQAYKKSDIFFSIYPVLYGSLFHLILVMRARNQNPLFFALRNSIWKLRTVFPLFIFQDWLLWLVCIHLCVHVSMWYVHGPWGPLKGTESLKQSWQSVQLWVLGTDCAFWKGSTYSYRLLSHLFSPECSTLGQPAVRLGPPNSL